MTEFWASGADIFDNDPVNAFFFSEPFGLCVSSLGFEIAKR
jgi:hypothetical protein